MQAANITVRTKPWNLFRRGSREIPNIPSAESAGISRNVGIVGFEISKEYTTTRTQLWAKCSRSAQTVRKVARVAKIIKHDISLFQRPEMAKISPKLPFWWDFCNFWNNAPHTWAIYLSQKARIRLCSAGRPLSAAGLIPAQTRNQWQAISHWHECYNASRGHVQDEAVHLGSCIEPKTTKTKWWQQ